MYYRVHDSNDSVVESIPDRLALIYYMKSKGIDKNSIKILFFRTVFWIRWVKQQGAFLLNLKRWRYRIVIASILLKIIKLIRTKYFWKTVLSRHIKR